MNNRNIRMITGLFVFILIPTLILPAALDPALQARCIALSSFLLIISIMYYSGKLSRDAGKFKNAAMLCFSGFIAVSLLSAVTALNSSEWLFHSAYFIILFILFAYYLLLYDVPGLIDTISGFAVISCIFISSIAIFQLYGWGFSWLPGNMGPYSTMVRRNMLASWLLLSLPFVFYSLLKASGKWRIIAFIAFTELAFVLFACQSRAAWLGAAAFMVCAVIIYLIIIKTGRLSKTDSTKYLKNSGIAAGIAIIIIVFGSIGGFRSQQSGITTQGSNPAARAASIMKFGSDTSARQRILAWKRSLKMSGDNLWLGVGLGNWKLNMNKYGIGEFYPDVQSGYVLYLQPHNDFLSVLCETGIFGLLFYIGILLSGFLYGIKAAFRNNNFSLFGLLGASAIAGYSVFAFFDFPKDRIEQQILLFLIIALTVSSSKKNSAEPKPIAKRYFIIPGLISLISILIFIIKLNSEIYIKDAIISRTNHEWKRVIEDVNNAYTPLVSVIDPMGIPMVFYRAEAKYMSGKIDAALKDYKAAMRASPYNFHILNDIGTCYMKSGDKANAIRYYNKALAISPNFEESLLNLSAAYYNAGNFVQAAQTISKCSAESKNTRVNKFKEIIFSKIKR